jgi:hypothetical protein
LAYFAQVPSPWVQLQHWDEHEQIDRTFQVRVRDGNDDRKASRRNRDTRQTHKYTLSFSLSPFVLPSLFSCYFPRPNPGLILSAPAQPTLCFSGGPSRRAAPPRGSAAACYLVFYPGGFIFN